VAELIAPAAVAYAERFTSPFGGLMATIADWTQNNTPSPGMMSGAAESRLLEALIVVGGASSVLEVGTFTGFGTLAMAGALPAGGRVTTLEVDEEIAAVARRHFQASPLGDRISLVLGDALETIGSLRGPYDLVYIDAWKADYPAYYEGVRGKLSDRGVIVADNLFRAGAALDPASEDPGTVGIREFAARVQADEGVHNVLLTIGDGVMVVWRRPG
jgi:caffeoyl-CoA O-methyltransferase